MKLSTSKSPYRPMSENKGVSDFHEWDEEKLGNFFQQRGLGQYGPVLRQHKITGVLAPLLSDNDLKEMGIQIVGDRLMFRHHLKTLARTQRYNKRMEGLWEGEERLFFSGCDRACFTLGGLCPVDPSTYKLTTNHLKVKKVQPWRCGPFPLICCGATYMHNNIDLSKVDDVDVMGVPAPCILRTCCCAKGKDLVEIESRFEKGGKVLLSLDEGKGEVVANMILNQVEESQRMERRFEWQCVAVMGIQGLHKGLSFATRKTSLQDFRGKTLAIDASSWLHRSVYSVAEKYVESMEQGRVDPQCVQASARYISSRCRELLGPFQMGKLFLVMDGKRCPLKTVTNDERERKRIENLNEARQFKRRGQRTKAEEKYKSCIKIRDALTIAVMKSVQQSFATDARVQLVWSPYEADAQLAKLCLDRKADGVITEDSDVLVYSATSHCSFPVIYKLDRHTGSCDVTSMDWLLSFQEENQPSNTNSKQRNVIETLLTNLASRQARREGFGVRLFVQACVLAGCDYAPNELVGVGLVGAFKFIRDNAFRGDTERFRKVLDSISKKHTLNIDRGSYELNLAKSEAIFYHHLVRHQDGSIAPLCAIDNSEPTARCFPSLRRFEGDLAFLGTMSVAVPSTHKAPTCLKQRVQSQVQSGVAKTQHQPTRPCRPATVKRPMAAARNPYLSKRTNLVGDSKSKTSVNPFNKFVRDSKTEKPASIGGWFTRESQPRRRDHPVAPMIVSDVPQVDEKTRSVTLPPDRDLGEHTSVFEYEASSNSVEYQKSKASHCTELRDYPQETEMPSFFELSDSNSRILDVDDADLDSSKPVRVSLEPSELQIKTDSNSSFDDIEEYSPVFSAKEDTKSSAGDVKFDAVRRTILGNTSSKYFRPGKAVGPKYVSASTHTSVKQDLQLLANNASSSKGAAKSSSSILSKPRRSIPGGHSKPPLGPLLRGFQRQVAGTVDNAVTRDSSSRTLRPPSKNRTIESYFPPAKKTRRSGPNQLPLGVVTSETDEQFLWETP
eukprot:Nitzschia sp. Nitz4//scaffold193_size40683//17234//20681//NITZ4_007499-RA/size40683-processed-gene-0.12-mRNA-1//1//CDS//3329540279//3216//frame0